MQIREAEEKDIPEIVDVLRASLGETDLPLSEEIWNYKHITNPFGKSLVLVAKEEEVIVGVRAFMRWKWQKGENIYSAFRAVDTATHPHHQGKGIFKNLTLKAVEMARKRGDHLVFNTPNEKSKPGYLKMGWKEAGKVCVGVKPALVSFWMLKSNDFKYKREIAASDIQLEELCSFWNQRLKNEERIFTPKSRSYLRWRYEGNALQKYEVVATENFYVAAYRKNRGRFKELRIAECIFYNWERNSSSINKIINEMSRKMGAQLITFSPYFFRSYRFSKTGFFGPVLTFRKLDINDALESEFLKIQNWRNSLGDLELF